MLAVNGIDHVLPLGVNVEGSTTTEPFTVGSSPGYAISTTFLRMAPSDSRYVPPRTTTVPPAGATAGVLWIDANGCAIVPGLLSLPPLATYSAFAGRSARRTAPAGGAPKPANTVATARPNT